MSSADQLVLKAAVKHMAVLPTPPPATADALSLSNEAEKKLRDAPVIYVKRVMTGGCSVMVHYEIYAGAMKSPGPMVMKVRSWKEASACFGHVLRGCNTGPESFDWQMQILKDDQHSYGVITLTEGPNGMPALIHVNEEYQGRIRNSIQSDGCSGFHSDIVDKLEHEKYTSKKASSCCDCSEACCKTPYGGCCTFMVKSYQYSQTNDVAFKIYEHSSCGEFMTLCCRHGIPFASA